MMGSVKNGFCFLHDIVCSNSRSWPEDISLIACICIIEIVDRFSSLLYDLGLSENALASIVDM